MIRRKIRNLQTGDRLNPWEIRPGVSIVRRSTGDVIRLAEVTYDHDARAASLTLGSPPLNSRQLIERLAKRAPVSKAINVTAVYATYHAKGNKKTKQKYGIEEV
ncbi:MAG: hypothetical protein HZY75_13405 [Nocardioidaceae bacterium]|nr:MAG: hypothetical protein HZY75_13405 [Nocardioidaceae bacterium]